MTVYTNLNTDDMCNEIRAHLVGATNKEYIRACICEHAKKKYQFITERERDMLLAEYGV